MTGGFQVGDVVVLRSGGAPMTVEEVIDAHSVKCVWCDDKAQVQRTTFVVATLELDD